MNRGRLCLTGTLLLVSTLAFAQSGGETPADGAVCPLSDSQTQKSIDAFARIAAAVTKEPRCTGCHGRVNPYIDGTGPDPENADTPPSQFEHGAGKVDRQGDCGECHSKMARKASDGSESRWMTAPDFLSFIGKDAPTLCKQIRGVLHTAETFLGHIKNDNGHNNFADTAFNGDRGLDREMFPETEVPTEKPHITHQELLKLGQDWVDSMGGEFQGDESCGCEPVHYSIRVSTKNEINVGPVSSTSIMQPVDVPITFNDDGTFSGDSAAKFAATAAAMQCSSQGTSSLNFHVSGQAVSTPHAQSMHFQFDNSSPTVTQSSIQCPYIGEKKTQSTTQGKVVIPFDLTGKVGEKTDYHMPGIPGVVSTMSVEIVKRE